MMKSFFEFYDDYAAGDRFRYFVLVCAVGLAMGSTIAFSASSHATGGDDTEGWLTHVDYYVGQDEVVDAIRTELIDEIGEAERRIDTAIAALDDEEIEEALIDAADRGVTVRVVADQYLEDSGQFDALVDHSDIAVVFGDGELGYLPDPNLAPILEYCDANDTEHDDHIECTNAEDPPSQLPEELWEEQLDRPPNNDSMIRRPAHYNVMSHTFFLIDDVRVWNITAPLNDEQPLWLAFKAMSEELTNSYAREFRQMHGGVFSTTLSVYNGPLKSITHQNPMRLTNEGQLRIRFNPQERLVKNVVDETFRARASVFVMTENLTNEDLIAALRYKAENGFDVRVMHGQGQAPTLLDELEPLDPVEAPAEMGRLPSFVIIDSERDRNGNRQPRQVQVLSHELWRAQPYEVIAELPSNLVRFYPSDTFADGVLWEIAESGSPRNPVQNPAVEPFIESWEQMWSEATND